MDRDNPDFNNPYSAMEGYRVFDAAGEEVGRVENTIYDEVSDVLKYIVVDGRPVPAEDARVNAHEDRVTIPFNAETVASAPKLAEFSGTFDHAVREHYGDPL